MWYNIRKWESGVVACEEKYEPRIPDPEPRNLRGGYYEMLYE